MAAADEDALRCDFAETYHVLDFRRLPLRTAAVFAQGLPTSSRIMRKLAGCEATADLLLLAQVCDYAGLILWNITGGKGDPPRSIVAKLCGEGPEAPQRFTSSADFDAAWSALTRGEENGN